MRKIKRETTIEPRVIEYNDQIMSVMKMNVDLRTELHLAIFSQILGMLLKQHGNHAEGLEIIRLNMMEGIKHAQNS